MTERKELPKKKMKPNPTRRRPEQTHPKANLFPNVFVRTPYGANTNTHTRELETAATKTRAKLRSAAKLLHATASRKSGCFAQRLIREKENTMKRNPIHPYAYTYPHKSKNKKK